MGKMASDVDQAHQHEGEAPHSDKPPGGGLRRESEPPLEQPSGGATVGDEALEHAVYATFAEAQPLQAAWNELAEREGDLFSSYEWCETWWRHYGGGRRLEIHTLHAGERLVGVLPLLRETLLSGGVRLRAVRLVGCDHTLDAAGLAIEAAYAASLLERVLDSLADRGRWDILQLGPLRSYAQVSEALAQAASDHRQVQAVLCGRCDHWLTVFDLADSYEGYLKGLQRVDRQNLARRERRLQVEHQTQVGVAHEPAEVERGMDNLVQLHQQLWIGKGQRGVFGDWPGYEQFHRDLARQLAESGRLSLITLEADGQAVGTTYGYHFGGRTHSMISGYRDDAEWRVYGIGRLLHSAVSREAIGQESKAIDDGRGVFEHKLRYGGRLEGERSVTIVRRGWLRRLRFWAALRIAYLLHGGYCRIWYDRLAPRLGLGGQLRDFYIRSSFLAQLFRRTRFGLFGGPVVQEVARAAPPSPPHRDTPAAQAPRSPVARREPRGLHETGYHTAIAGKPRGRAHRHTRRGPGRTHPAARAAGDDPALPSGRRLRVDRGAAAALGRAGAGGRRGHLLHLRLVPDVVALLRRGPAAVPAAVLGGAGSW